MFKSFLNMLHLAIFLPASKATRKGEDETGVPQVRNVFGNLPRLTPSEGPALYFGGVTL